jgi:NAD-dependent dihydropyrimidine dehydrogenase PreA subunit
MAKRIAVVVSQGQSANPAKRQLEEDIVAGLLMEPGIDVVIIPHLYDLKADGTGMLALRGIMGNMIVLSWLYERGARWTLDRFGIRGKEGLTTIKVAEDEEADEDEEAAEDVKAADDGKERVNDSREIPNRRIYCIDLRAKDQAQPYIDEVKRIARENAMQLVGLGGWIGGSPKPEQMQRYLSPTNDTALPLPSPLVGEGSGVRGEFVEIKSAPVQSPSTSLTFDASQVVRIEEDSGRRWYPVIDYSRCTNCMECIDFCLFGVYGVDKVETILVEQPDNCRKGCPACSRVCPENAIIFPQHKTPTIAGSPVVAGSLKIDLSKLFGAPETGESAEQAAIRERDEQLLLAGRAAVGDSIGLPKRHATQLTSTEPKDELDSLIDALDNF